MRCPSCVRSATRVTWDSPDALPDFLSGVVDGVQGMTVVFGAGSNRSWGIPMGWVLTSQLDVAGG